MLEDVADRVGGLDFEVRQRRRCAAGLDQKAVGVGSPGLKQGHGARWQHEVGDDQGGEQHSDVGRRGVHLARVGSQPSLQALSAAQPQECDEDGDVDDAVALDDDENGVRHGGKHEIRGTAP